MKARDAKIESVFYVANRVHNIYQQISVTGSGQKTMEWVRTQYPKFTRFVLRGHKVDGVFCKLKFPSQYESR